jgi:hypothetical protein
MSRRGVVDDNTNYLGGLTCALNLALVAHVDSKPCFPAKSLNCRSGQPERTIDPNRA